MGVGFLAPHAFPDAARDGQTVVHRLVRAPLV
jgi:hypothetical protein